MEGEVRGLSWYCGWGRRMREFVSSEEEEEGVEDDEEYEILAKVN